MRSDMRSDMKSRHTTMATRATATRAAWASIFAGAAALAGCFLYVACSGDDDTVKETVTPDSGPVTTNDGGDQGAGSDGGPDGGPTDCVQNPVTYLDIINACTGPGVTKIEKNPTLDKLLPDGGLPPVN
jgi:hypothetical protein